MTVRVARALANATLVLAPVELWPLLTELSPKARLEPPKNGPQEEAQDLARASSLGEQACRAYPGDPLVASSAQRTLEALAELSVPFTVASGLVAELDLAARFGLPFFRSEDPSPSYAVAEVSPDHLGTFDWERLATATDTLVLWLPSTDVAEVLRTLVFHGRSGSAPTLCLTADETLHGTLEGLARAFAARPPQKARIVVGPGVQKALAHRARLPLAGKRVLVTRARAQADELASRLREEGAEPVFFPVLDFAPSDDPEGLAKASADLAHGHFRAVLFTSQNAVTAFIDTLREGGHDARAFGKAILGAIGTATAAALEAAGLKADFVAKESVGEGLAAIALEALGPATPGDRVLLPRAKVARDVVRDALVGAGYDVEVVTAYVTRPAETRDSAARAISARLLAGQIEAVTLTSSSTATHLVAALGSETLGKTVIASLGPITTKTAEGLGLKVAVTASTYTTEGLIAALRTHFSAHSDAARR